MNSALSRKAAVTAALLLAAIFSFHPAGAAEEITGRAAWVYDGDSFKMLDRGRTLQVRVFGIDCPEKGQPYARQALSLTIRLVKNRLVKVRVKDIDAYGRVVGEVILPDGRSLGEELVRAGLAWHYRRYSDDENLARLEAEARAAGRGLWRQADPVPPWIYKNTGD